MRALAVGIWIASFITALVTIWVGCLSKDQSVQNVCVYTAALVGILGFLAGDGLWEEGR